MYGLLAALAIAVAWVLYLLRDPTPYFLERRSAIASLEEQPVEREGEHSVQLVRVVGESGLEVDLMLKGPARWAGEPLPLVVILGGHRTGREAAKLIGDTHGMLVAAVSYPYRGKTRVKGPAVLLQARAIRAGMLDTPPALMLALDYLLRRPDVDSSRVEGVGVSLGVPFIAIAGALDHRFSRIWAVHGTGGSFAPLEHNLRTFIGFGPVRKLAAGLANVIISGPQLAADNWAPRISPRPFVMISAEDDERYPRASVDLLFDSAREPKQHAWMPGRHIRSEPEQVQELVEFLLQRMRPDTTTAALPVATDPAASLVSLRSRSR